MGISEAVLLTSIQEGFGLPYLEAAAARRPLVARALPNIAPDCASSGFAFPSATPRSWFIPPCLNGRRSGPPGPLFRAMAGTPAARLSRVGRATRAAEPPELRKRFRSIDSP
jgi:glycosyltransferase involved in cell wall biosynthesis